MEKPPSLSPLLPALVLREAGDSPVSDRRVNIASFLSSLPRWATRVQGWATIATVGNKHCHRGQRDENENVRGGVRRMIQLAENVDPSIKASSWRLTKDCSSSQRPVVAHNSLTHRKYLHKVTQISTILRDIYHLSAASLSPKPLNIFS